MDGEVWKVGELAERTGVSVRTLHYYDEIGLFEPSDRSRSGHRLYTSDDVVRLQQIKSLRQLGFSLEEIREALDRPGYAPGDVIGLHIERLRERIDLQQRLCDRLVAIRERLESKQRPSVEEFIRTIEEIGMMEKLEKYYTPEQAACLKERGDALGQDAIRQAEADWKSLIAKVREEMDKGTDPKSEPVRALASRWQALIDAFTGGDAGITKSLGRVWQNEPGLRTKTGIDSEMFAYIGQALAELKRPESDGQP